MSSVLAPSPVALMGLSADDPGRMEEMLDAVRRVAASGQFTLGAEVEAFEAEFAAFNQTRRCVGVSSGTEALVLALRALGIGPGDEVLLPANSFIATAEAVSMVGAAPWPIDVDPDTHLITAAGVEAAVGPRTACVIPVHLMGATADMPPIMAVARRYGLRVIEDTAQAHGARLDGRRAGTFGDVGCFSFYPTKNLGAWGDGGAVITDDDALADRVALLRCHGEGPRYHHAVVGTTARLHAIQAAVLRIKLRDLEVATAARRRLGAVLTTGLAGADVEVPTRSCPQADHVYHLFVVRSPRRAAFRDHLAAAGIATAVHYPVPIHRTAAYAALGLPKGSRPVAERLADEICTLPLHPGLPAEDAERIVAAVQSFDGAGS